MIREKEGISKKWKKKKKGRKVCPFTSLEGKEKTQFLPGITKLFVYAIHKHCFLEVVVPLSAAAFVSIHTQLNPLLSSSSQKQQLSLVAAHSSFNKYQIRKEISSQHIYFFHFMVR